MGLSAVLCLFLCTAFESKTVQLPLVAKIQPTICCGVNLRTGPWVSLEITIIQFWEDEKSQFRLYKSKGYDSSSSEVKRLIPTSDPAGRRRRISWHTDSTAPPQSIVFPPMGSSTLYTFSNECLPTGCVLSILCPPWAIQTKKTQN